MHQRSPEWTESQHYRIRGVSRLQHSLSTAYYSIGSIPSVSAYVLTNFTAVFMKVGGKCHKINPLSGEFHCSNLYQHVHTRNVTKLFYFLFKHMIYLFSWRGIVISFFPCVVIYLYTDEQFFLYTMNKFFSHKSDFKLSILCI